MKPLPRPAETRVAANLTYLSKVPDSAKHDGADAIKKVNKSATKSQGATMATPQAARPPKGSVKCQACPQGNLPRISRHEALSNSSF